MIVKKADRHYNVDDWQPSGVEQRQRGFATVSNTPANHLASAVHGSRNFEAAADRRTNDHRVL